ncbi:MAG: GGDEF domain-containing protein [Bacillota bacterium]|nr:GGDEF domain-containing protein [Bacillota bacterium]
MFILGYFNKLITFCRRNIRESIEFSLKNKELLYLKKVTIIAISIYILLNIFLLVPYFSLISLFVIFSLTSFYALIISNFFGYLGLVVIILAKSFLIVLSFFHWETINQYYNLSWQHEVYARQFSEELYLVFLISSLFIILGSFFVSISVEKERRRRKELEELSVLDGLTEIYNHRYFHQKLDEEIARYQRNKSNVSLMMIDIDRFKQYNDTYGHRSGDILLKKCAQFFKGMVRIDDIVCRYGGDEFAIILPGKNEKEVSAVANRIKNAFRFQNGWLDVTLSIGFSVYPNISKDKESLILHADKALYKAKQMGRDKVQSSKDI